MAAPAPFGVYVHWPFCLSKCPYCDFNSHVRDAVEQPRWRQALLAELADYAQHMSGRRVSSIFFGGGTPSLMPVETVAAVLEQIARLWPLADDLEITLEANPTSVEAGRFRALAQAGVNRVSLGIQALESQALAFLGRGHTLDEALAAIELARASFGRMSFDLIYARPGQSLQQWTSELDRAIALAADHLSLYQLTIEKGTRFWQDHRQQRFALPDQELAAELYEATQERLAAAGLPAYEISNHARPGAACRHNLGYWRYEDYIGVGPGAHGRFAIDAARPAAGKLASRAIAAPEAWLERVERTGNGCVEQRRVVGADLAVEALMMGLRLSEGIDRQRFCELTGVDLLAAVDGDALQRLLQAGFVALDARRFAATAAGRQRLNAVLQQLLT